MPSSSPTIVVAGAGSIGCFVGGQLAAAGRDVRFLARPRVAAELAAHGLTLTDREGGEVRLAGTVRGPRDLSSRRGFSRA